MGRGKGKKPKFMAMAHDAAGRMSSSRHQRRKLEKLAKRHPNEFLQASKKYEGKK